MSLRVIRSPAICRLVRGPHFGLRLWRLLLPSLDADPLGCTCLKVVFRYTCESCGRCGRQTTDWKRSSFGEFRRRSQSVERNGERDAAAKGGFQVGQTAKARPGPPCAVTPAEMRTWPPALFPQSIEADWYNTKSVEACTDGSSIAYEVMFTPRQPWATLKGSGRPRRGISAAA